MKTLDEFKHAGGVLGGSKTHTHEEYDGAPRPYNEKLSTTIEKVLPGHHGSSGTSSGITGSNSGSGLTGSNTGTSGSHTGHHNTSNLGTTDRRPDSGIGSDGYDNKPSMMDKLNPRVDANGDGKAGFMK